MIARLPATPERSADFTVGSSMIIGSGCSAVRIGECRDAISLDYWTP